METSYQAAAAVAAADSELYQGATCQVVKGEQVEVSEATVEDALVVAAMASS